ncbi:hypothetical protein [Psychrosphaera aestuarii]|uniref:hypothetical protein n=1 Tax=Psychrosphaera aestuarii TaxID=1266052 RepID=UPI001B32461C|nr:hypothetical protein [Psychrosphaera aestuarii]
MKIEQYLNDDGEFRCFGFSNTFFHKKDVKNFVESLPDSKITFFTNAHGVEDFCEFTYRGENFKVCEPYGDNSFYDIFCETADAEPLLEIYDKFCDIAESGKAEKSNKLKLVVWAIVIVLFAAIVSSTSN